MLNHKVSYKKIVSSICIICALLCNVGLSEIVMIAKPILSLMYPLIITLLVLNVCKVNGRAPFILGSISAFGISVMNVLCDTFHVEIFQFIHYLPFHTYGMNFVVPTIVLIGIDLIIDLVQKKNIQINYVREKKSAN